MIKKVLLSFATLALAAATAASYRLTLFQATIVNGKELKPGDYKVEVQGDKAILRKGKDSVEAPVTVETASEKFRSTTVRYQNGDGKYRIQEIRLGGTNTKLIFN